MSGEARGPARGDTVELVLDEIDERGRVLGRAGGRAIAVRGGVLGARVLARVRSRKRREIDPTLTTLRQCLIDARSEGGDDPLVVERIESMVEFVQASAAWYDEVRRLPQPILVKLLKLGAKVARLIPSRA